jgi:hypothetical protein
MHSERCSKVTDCFMILMNNVSKMLRYVILKRTRELLLFHEQDRSISRYMVRRYTAMHSDLR